MRPWLVGRPGLPGLPGCNCAVDFVRPPDSGPFVDARAQLGFRVSSGFKRLLGSRAFLDSGPGVLYSLYVLERRY